MNILPPVKGRVLVVDDDRALIELLIDSLRLLGHYEVVVADDGDTGLAMYYKLRPDCVVVDVRMPKLNGYYLVRALRGDPATAQTPIVMLSAMVQDRDKLVGLMSGADAYLIKPVKIAELIAAIEHAMSLNAMYRARRDVVLLGDIEEVD